MEVERAHPFFKSAISESKDDVHGLRHNTILTLLLSYTNTFMKEKYTRILCIASLLQTRKLRFAIDGDVIHSPLGYGSLGHLNLTVGYETHINLTNQLKSRAILHLQKIPLILTDDPVD